jgi:hypothetical protein
LIREVVANVAVKVTALGICAEKLVVATRRNMEERIGLAVAELQFQQMPVRMV